jgi:hypothetical protein
MIVGGQAVLLYGRPRLTRDIDITLGVDTDQFAVVHALCRDLDLAVLVEDAEPFAQTTKVLPAEDPVSRIRVDFIFSFTPYETQALERTQTVLMEDYSIRFAACEDVIVHKMLAGRPVDEDDVRHMLAKNRHTLDCEYVRNWLSEFGRIPEHGDILARFEALANE